MPKDKKRRTPATRIAPRKPQMFRFTAETAEMLETASERAGMSKTVYVMLALKHQFQADGLLPPDPIFAAAPLPPDDRKARPPRGNSSQAK
jgi:TraY domain